MQVSTRSLLVARRNHGNLNLRVASQLDANAGSLRPVLWIVAKPGAPVFVHFGLVIEVGQEYLRREYSVFAGAQFEQIVFNGL